MKRRQLFFAYLLVAGLVLPPLNDAHASPQAGGTQSGSQSAAPPAQADLAKQSQNPIGSLVSVPFENYTNFGFGVGDDVQNVLQIQAVYPVSLGENWNLIPRFIVPVMSQPVPLPSVVAPLPGGGEVISGFTERSFGLGDINGQFYFSPKKAGKVIWGVGPSLLMNTSTASELGTGMWSAGPAVVVLTMPGNFVIGSLFAQLWSFTEPSSDGFSYRFTELVPPGSDASVNSFTWQYFVNYNLDKGWFLTTGPTMTANWDADEVWTVPVGGGLGKIFQMGSQPAKWEVQSFYNVVRPDNAASWTLLTEFVLLFPKS